MSLTTPPPGAPNIILILLDDVGFGTCSTFGGPVPTPTLDRVARQGLSFNQFHTTALCSPTRAAMLTGRNHHAVHMGGIPEAANVFPGYDSVIPKEAATVAEILRQSGYSTSAFGKWHLTPLWEQTPTGPFDRWPTGIGFEHVAMLAGDTTRLSPGCTVASQRYISMPKSSTEAAASRASVTSLGVSCSWLRSSTAPPSPGSSWFGDVVVGVDHSLYEEELEKLKHERNVTLDTDLSTEDLKELVQRYKAVFKKASGSDFPTGENPYSQSPWLGLHCWWVPYVPERLWRR